MIKNIQKVHVGEDYTAYTFEEDGEMVEVEVTGAAQKIIDALGVALHKQSFLEKNENNIH